MKTFILVATILVSYSQLFSQTQNVGIGTLSPAFKLDVRNGSINTDSVYRIGTTTVLSVLGTGNLFVGKYAGFNNTSGFGNSFFGLGAGTNNIQGNNNSIFGEAAGSLNTGSSNSFFGKDAGYFNNTGSSNSFFGQSAGASNSAGGFNSFFGRSAGSYNDTGTRNTILGYAANVNSSALTNATAIGAHAGVDCSNCMVLGSVNGINGATSGVNVGIGTANPDLLFQVAKNTSYETGTSYGIAATNATNTNLRLNLGYDATIDAAVIQASHEGNTFNKNLLLNPNAGNVGIGVNSPDAKLSISADGVELVGTAAGTILRTNAGYLGNTVDSELSLANIGFRSGNNSSLGVRAYRTNPGSDWMSTALLFEYDVDDTPRAGGYLALSSNGNIGIGTKSPAFKLDVQNGSINTDSVYRIDNFTVLATPYFGNLFVGVEAGFVNQGYYNTFSGYRAGYTNTSANNNTFTGYLAGTSNTGGDNSFFGSYAGLSNTTGNFNCFFGRSTGYSNSTGFENSFFGGATGVLNSSGSSNSFFGSAAGYHNTTGSDNSFFGKWAGTANITGYDNSFFGRDAGLLNTEGYENSFFGRGAGSANTSGIQNSFFGKRAGFANNTGNYNSFFGMAAGEDNTTGEFNSFFGAAAGSSNTTGYNNSFFGRAAGASNTTGNYNSFFGDGAGYWNTTGGFNSFFGLNAGSSNTIGFDNSFFGKSAGLSNTEGNFNSFFGVDVGLNNNTGTNNSFFGWSSGKSNTTGSFNSFFGLNAGRSTTIGSDNSFFGLSAGFANTTGANNAFYGRAAGLSNSLGNDNSFFGRNAGISNTIGTLNTTIGYNSDVDVGLLTNASAIGSNALVECSNCMVLGSVNGINSATSNINVGIGINAPLARLHVSSGSSGNSTPFSPLVVEGNNNTYINLLSPNINETAILFGKADNSSSGGIVYNNSTNLNGLQFRVNGNTTKMALYFDGNAWLQGFLTQGSDLRLKKEIHPLQNSLQKITQLNGYNYYWKNENADSELQTGVIAQEVQKLFPELVKEDKEGMLSVNYSGLIPVLIESIKEQQKQNDQQQKHIDFLMKELAVIKQR